MSISEPGGSITGMACKRDRFHAFHDNLACCIECGFHSTSTDILEDGCIISEVSELVLCPEGHALFPTVCPIEDCLASYKEFHRERNAVKCSQCDYPVRVFDLPDEEYDISEEQRAIITCAGCGNNSTNRLFMMPYDDDQNILAVSCFECRSNFLIYNKEEDSLEESFSHSANGKHATCYKREPILTGDQIQPLDHIEFPADIPKIGVLPAPYEHHLVVAYIMPEQKKFYAYEYLRDGVQFSEYTYDYILKKQSFRYIYDEKVCLPEEQQHQFAEMKMNEDKYTFYKNNCESYARWIKTGIGETLQPVRAAAAVLKPLIRTAGILFVQALTEFAPHAMRTEVMGWVGIGIVSIAWLSYKFYKLKGKRDDGSITNEDFKNEVIMEICKTTGTAIGAAVGGLLTIPTGGFGFILSGVFGALGSLVGSFVGATAGRWIGNKIVATKVLKTKVTLS